MGSASRECPLKMMKNFRNIAFLLYLVAVHALLVVTLIKTDMVPRMAVKLGLRKLLAPNNDVFVADRSACLQEFDRFVPTGETIFMGDSITSDLPTDVIASIASPAINYGIGWQRSDQLMNSMGSYVSIQRSRRVILMIGTNDLLQDRESGLELRYKTILEKIPANIPVVFSSIPPISITELLRRKIDVSNVSQAVLSAKRVCDADRRCRFVNAYDSLSSNGVPLPGVLLNDGIHLAPYGYVLWAESVRQSLTPTIK